MQFLTASVRWWRTVVAALLLAPASSAAQASANVPLHDPAYEYIDLLVHEGLLDSVIVSHRPMSRREVGRLAAAARARIESRLGEGSGTPSLSHAAASRRAERVNAVLRRLDQRFGEDRLASLDRVTADAAFVNSPPREVPDNGLGFIDAVVNPIADQDQGLEFIDGFSQWVVAGAQLQLAPFLAGGVAVRQSNTRGRGGRWDSAVRVDQLYVTVGARNVLLQAGRDELAIGSGRSSPFVSGNVPYLDMIKVGSSRPFLMPWLLRRLGPTRVTAFAADLGGNRTPAHDWFVGYRASFLPARNVEFGISVSSQQGGSGSPEASAGERIIDLFPLIDVLFIQSGDLQISNKFSGVDLRVRLPRARAAEVFGELVFDDFDYRRIGSSVLEDAGITAGIDVPRLSADGRWRGSLEHQRTGIRYYMHGEFISGATRSGRLIGNPLGPNGRAGVAELRFAPDLRREVGLSVAYEQRSADRYTSRGGTSEETLEFIKTESFPEERRLRGMLRGHLEPRQQPIRIVGQLGLERVTNFSFAAGASRTNALTRVGIEARF